MKTITRSDLLEQLYDERGASVITIVATTEPRLYKYRDGERNPYLGTVKRAAVNGMMNWIYANSVNNQRMREAEGDSVEFFVPLERTWGDRIWRPDGTVTPLVEYEGRFYLEMKIEKSLRFRYELNGEDVKSELLRKWLYPRRESARQNVRKPIILRDYAIDHIDYISMRSEIYSVVTSAA